MDPFRRKVHVAVGEQKTACGRDAAKVLTVPPRQARVADCQRCKAALRW